jgi:anti-sigma regulatory factor (Ser/Thr protein kinase)
MVRGWAEIESNLLHVRLDAVPDSVPEARLRVRTWCEQTGLCERTQDDLLLAVTEAASNVVVHAYPDGRDGGFSLDLHGDARAVVVEISDEGVGPSGAAPSSGGGLGLEIIGRMFPGFTLVESEPGTRVTIRASAA